MNRQTENRFHQQWEKIHTERFLKKIGKKGYCAYEDYLLLCEVLNYRGVESAIYLEEYQEEQDLQGQSYYYFIPWNELGEKLEKNQIYVFTEGSVIRIKVCRRSRKIEAVQDYYYGKTDGNG